MNWWQRELPEASPLEVSRRWRAALAEEIDRWADLDEHPPALARLRALADAYGALGDLSTAWAADAARAGWTEATIGDALGNVGARLVEELLAGAEDLPRCSMPSCRRLRVMRVADAVGGEGDFCAGCGQQVLDRVEGAHLIERARNR